MRWTWLLALAACGPAKRMDPPMMTAPDAPAQATSCYEASVSGTASVGTSSVESCAIWNSLAEMTGGVTLTRDQTSLTMAFATGVTFTGTVVGNNVDLTYSNLHDFEDGCTWRATETLTGALDPATCVMMLGYHYAETVEVSNGACATPCSGTGTVSFQISPIL